MDKKYKVCVDYINLDGTTERVIKHSYEDANIYIQFVICVLMVPLAATLDKEAQKKKP